MPSSRRKTNSARIEQKMILFLKSFRSKELNRTNRKILSNLDRNWRGKHGIEMYTAPYFASPA